MSDGLQVLASHVLTALRNAGELQMKFKSSVLPPAWAALLGMHSCCSTLTVSNKMKERCKADILRIEENLSMLRSELE